LLSNDVGFANGKDHYSKETPCFLANKIRVPLIASHQAMLELFTMDCIVFVFGIMTYEFQLGYFHGASFAIRQTQGKTQDLILNKSFLFLSLF
jgi:hypothetical protein